MAESKKISLDTLPDEIILKILENLEGLTDKSNVAKVCRKLYRLANDKYWRKRIHIHTNEFKQFSGKKWTTDSCVDSILKEIDHSKPLDMLTFEFPKRPWGFIDAMKYVKPISLNVPKLSNYNGICLMRDSEYCTHAMYFFSPNYKGSNHGRTIPYYLSSPTYLTISEKKNMEPEKIVKNYIETLKEIEFRGQITKPLLRQLSKAKKLSNVVLSGKLAITTIVNEIELQNIKSEAVSLFVSPFHEIPIETPKIIADIFFCDTLHLLDITFSLFRGLENEICSKCPNLRILNIIQNELEVSNDLFSYFCTNLLRSINNHSLIDELQFLELDTAFESILLESISTNLTVDYTIHSPDDEEEPIIVEFTRQEQSWFPPETVLNIINN